MSFVDAFGRELERVAARRLVRARRRHSLKVVLVCAILVVGVGVPAAAEFDWNPFAGHSDAPTTTDAPPARQLYSMLAVLRRPQSAADRSDETAFALRAVGRSTYSGVNVRYVRRVDLGDAGGAVVLIPAAAHRLTPDAPPDFDVVCLWRTDFAGGKPIGGARGCYSASRIANGTALQSLGHRIDMLVPDGVSAVEAVAANGTTTRTVPVDNVASWQGGLPSTLYFVDSNGTRSRTDVH